MQSKSPCRSALLHEVPYSRALPHLFFGEEQWMLARMWTRGWDVFAPPEAVAFHLWERAARHSTFQKVCHLCKREHLLNSIFSFL